MVKWICVFVYVRIRARWIRPYAWRSVSWLFRGWMLGVYGVFRGYLVGVRCIINNPFVAKWQAVSSCRGWFIVPVYTCSPHIRKTLGHIYNPFETHLCNVRNVFVICVLHIRRVKVWFLRCKNYLFGLQKPPFWPAKSGFLYLRKYISIFIDINKEYERTYNKFIKMVYNSLKRQPCHCVLYIFYIWCKVK